MTLFVRLCAEMEGFWKPGSIPARDHNPLDLRHSPHSEHPGDPNAIGQIDNDADGWADAELQARRWANRGLTLKQAIYTEAPPNVDNNNSSDYLQYVINGFHKAGWIEIDEDSAMTYVLTIQDGVQG